MDTRPDSPVRSTPRGPPRGALGRRFYAGSSVDVARRLLGKLLWCGDRTGHIVETEAYLGPEDLASHARFGPGGRSATMFGVGGAAYVYLIYGMHEMFNVVTGRAGEGSAVLVRAAAPLRGIDGGALAARGPGKLCRAFGIDRRLNGADLTLGGEIGIAAGRRIDPSAIATGPRVGVDYAGRWAHEPLRFWIAGHPAVSRAPRPTSSAGPKRRGRPPRSDSERD